MLQCTAINQTRRLVLALTAYAPDFKGFVTDKKTFMLKPFPDVIIYAVIVQLCDFVAFRADDVLGIVIVAMILGAENIGVQTFNTVDEAFLGKEIERPVNRHRLNIADGFDNVIGFLRFIGFNERA